MSCFSEKSNPLVMESGNVKAIECLGIEDRQMGGFIEWK